MKQLLPESASRPDVVAEITRLYEQYGAGMYAGEAVTQLQHALQAAHFAEQAGEPTALIAAALLHDIGHLTHEFDEDCARQGIDDRHEATGADWLSTAAGFGLDVTEPIRLHVPAKRYLCATDADYVAQLSDASRLSLKLQGGPFSSAEVDAFRNHKYFEAAVRLRGYDEQAKQVDLPTPPLTHFISIVAAVLASSTRSENML
jgi:phosphonate degradation associated HDIG domain protein